VDLSPLTLKTVAKIYLRQVEIQDSIGYTLIENNPTEKGYFGRGPDKEQGRKLTKATG
jgi:hypothetical protein